MTDDSLQQYAADCAERVERAMDQWLPQAELPPARLHQAMRYAALGGGKRIRPMLSYATGRALGLPPERIDGAACAVELIHAYSLVHDDLPAMDDDDLRRGQPTCHKQFDEATAILTGDALQTLAFQVLCKDPAMRVSDATRVRMIEQLAFASGSRGMCGGQAIDLDATGRELDLPQLETMHMRKTGALVRAAVKLAAFTAEGTDEAAIKHLDHYAKCIGLAFQIRDDILDVEGDPDLIGKTRGKDALHDKPTYPSLMGLEAAREKAADLRRDALQSLDGFDDRAAPLRQLADYIVARNR